MNNKIVIVILLLMVLFEGLCISMSIDIINDKTAYINGLLSDRAICNGKLDSIIQDYEKLSGEIDG
jgi:hypothetical protein